MWNSRRSGGLGLGLEGSLSKKEKKKGAHKQGRSGSEVKIFSWNCL